MKKNVGTKALIRTPNFILRIKGGIHASRDKRSNNAKNHVSNQISAYAGILETRIDDIMNSFGLKLDSIQAEIKRLESQYEGEMSSNNPEINKHAKLIANTIRDLASRIDPLEKERDRLIKRTEDEYKRKICEYLHHTPLTLKDLEARKEEPGNEH